MPLGEDRNCRPRVALSLKSSRFGGGFIFLSHASVKLTSFDMGKHQGNILIDIECNS